jgi:hypothetical protein
MLKPANGTGRENIVENVVMMAACKLDFVDVHAIIQNKYL